MLKLTTLEPTATNASMPMPPTEKTSKWPSYEPDEIAAVVDVLQSGKVNYWTGKVTQKFEDEFAEAIGTKHAIALANGTVALNLALKFLVNPGNEVVVTPRSFIASVSSVVESGCKPVFADVDVNTQNITANSIAKVLTEKTRAIIVVHLAGMPADMDPIMALAEERGLVVIEDCAQAHGAKYKGRSVGSIGDVGVWSFCQDKIMTTGGEGGMVTVNNEELWRKMWSYKDHGKSWEKTRGAGATAKSSEYKWVHDQFGTNWRMTEMQSAIGRVQLRKLPSWQATREANARKIWDICRTMPWLRVPTIPSYVQHGAYKAYVFVDNQHLPEGWNRQRIVSELSLAGALVFSGSCPEIYREAAFDGTGLRPAERLPIAKELGEQSLMFLCHPNVKISEIDQVSRALESVGRMIGSETSLIESLIPRLGHSQAIVTTKCQQRKS